MDKQKSEKKLNNSGFSLLEILVAFIVLAIVVTPFLRAFLTSSSLNAKGRISSQATTLAENIFEGLKVKTYLATEESGVVESATAESESKAADDKMKVKATVPHLENITYMFNYPNVAGKNNFYVLPSTQVSEATIGQFCQRISVDESGVESVALAANNITSTDGGVTYAFKEASDFKYYYYILKAKEQKQYYDVLISLDGTAYQKGAASSGNEYNNVEMVKIPNIDTTKDAVISKSVESEAVINLKKQLKNVGITDYDDKLLTRKITVTVYEKDNHILVDYEMTYGYRGNASGIDFSTIYFSSGTKNVLDVEKSEFRNVFLMYEPLYQSQSIENPQDEIEIRNNKKDSSDRSKPLAFDFYIIKQERFGLDEQELKIKENSYRVKIKVEDNSSGGANASKMGIKTNLGTNLYKMHDETAASMPKVDQAIYYDNNGLSYIGNDAVKRKFNISDIYEHESQSNYFDVTIKIYEHLEGASLRNSLEKFTGQPLVEFTGSIQN